MAKGTGVKPGTIKPGWTTTEFAQTVVTQLLAVAATILSVLDPQADLGALQALVPSIAILASAAAQFGYSLSRARVKAAASDSSAVAAAAADAARIVADSAAGASLKTTSATANGNHALASSVGAPRWVG